MRPGRGRRGELWQLRHPHAHLQRKLRLGRVELLLGRGLLLPRRHADPKRLCELRWRYPNPHLQRHLRVGFVRPLSGRDTVHGLERLRLHRPVQPARNRLLLDRLDHRVDAVPIRVEADEGGELGDDLAPSLEVPVGAEQQQ